MITSFYQKYCEELTTALQKLNMDDLDKIADVLWTAYKQDRRIYIIGNGGSAATASHYVCDFGKGAAVTGQKRMKVISLSDNMSHMTAISNDISYDEVFKEQLENLLEPQDVLLCISASGNSPNLIRAAEYANRIAAITIGILGFDGGKLKALTKQSLVVDNFNYGQVEDIHLLLGHVMSQYFRKLILEEEQACGEG